MYTIITLLILFSIMDIYLSSKIGVALRDSLNELEEENEIREELSKKVEKEFNQVICRKFKEMNQT